MSDVRPGKSVERLMASGMAWTVSFRLIDRLLALVSTIVLARLLVPEDFGVVAMASAFLAMIEVFRGLGFEAALIRNSESSKDEFDTAWTLNLLLGVLSFVAMVAGARHIAEFFHEPRAEHIVYLLALVPVLEGVMNIGVVEFRKKLDFRQDFQLQFARRILAVSVTVGLALVLRSYWALPIGTVMAWCIGVLLSYRWHPYRPQFSLKAVRQIIGFSGWIFLNNFLMFLRLRGASFVVGRFAGPSSLGVFELAYEISNLPTSALVMPINRALFPGYVQLREKPAEFRNGVIQVIGGVALLAIAAGVGIANVAPLIVEAFLGPKWHAATAPIQLLALFGVSIALQVNMQSVYNALGRPNLQASITGATVLILLPLMVWLVLRDGVRGAATAYLVTGMVMLPVNYAFCVRLVGFGWAALFGVLWRPILAAAAMSWVLQTSIFSDVAGGGAIHAFGALIVASSVGVVVYGAVVAALWWISGKPEGAESFMLRFAKRIAARTKDGAKAG